MITLSFTTRVSLLPWPFLLALISFAMPYKSPFQIGIPATDVLSYLFPQGQSPSDQPVWIDAENAQANSLSPKQLLQWVKRLGSGLDNLGLKQNDVVMIFSSNHIFVPCAYLGIAGSGRIFSGCNPTYGVAGKLLLRGILYEG